MDRPVLTVNALTRRFARRGKPITAVDDVSFYIEPAETLALAGPSGSGKSTIARLLLRLIEPDAGTINFDGEDFLALKGAALRRQRAKIQMVFQDPLAAFNPRATVAGVLGDPLRIHGIASKADRPRHITRLLERVGLSTSLQHRAMHEISGGQRQRVAIARAIATKPLLVVLDEALSALDVSVRGKILELLLDLQREEKLAYLFISHDLGVVRSIAHRIAILDSGKIAEEGNARTVIDAPQSVVGKALVAAVPTLAADVSHR
ncbi:MAG TPA: ATP-binding cassette domain-containing protein [Mesorhizobium sp.]